MYFKVSYGSIKSSKHVNEDFNMTIFYAVMLLLLGHISFAHSEQPLYTYPVAGYEAHGNKHLLVLNQWSLELELYDWNNETGQINKVLAACYTPASVSILPDISGFSFVDNGRIRIKRFEKRAVKTLDIYEPVYGIEIVRWLDAQTCYFHAQSDGRFGIYSLTIEEELSPLLISATADFLYPSIINNNLFFIEHGIDRDYAIGTCSLTCNDKIPVTIINFSTKPLCFLYMKNLKEGFVIECDKKALYYLFHYHHLIDNGSQWQHEQLFSFEIPQEFFINGPQHLYESLVPLIPRMIGDKIYFSSYNTQTGYLDLSCFCIITRSIEQVASNLGHIFPPYFIGSEGWAGGSIFPCQKIKP